MRSRAIAAGSIIRAFTALPNGTLRRVELHWYEAHGKGKGTLRSKVIWASDLTRNANQKHFALCIDNTDYKASLVPGKIYRILKDAKGSKNDLVRIVDESGEDYLYHKSLFVLVDLPRTLAKKLIAIEKAA